MISQTNNLTSRYAFILCLSVAILFSQTFKAHMHLQHSDVISEVAQDHIVDIHVDAGLFAHASMHNTHHQDDFIDHQPHAEIDVSIDSFVKKIGKISLSLLLFIVIGFILSVPVLLIVSKHYLYKVKTEPLYYFINPPLRAPPL